MIKKIVVYAVLIVAVPHALAAFFLIPFLVEFYTDSLVLGIIVMIVVALILNGLYESWKKKQRIKEWEENYVE